MTEDVCMRNGDGDSSNPYATMGLKTVDTTGERPSPWEGLRRWSVVPLLER